MKRIYASLETRDPPRISCRHFPVKVEKEMTFTKRIFNNGRNVEKMKALSAVLCVTALASCAKAEPDVRRLCTGMDDHAGIAACMSLINKGQFSGKELSALYAMVGIHQIHLAQFKEAKENIEKAISLDGDVPDDYYYKSDIDIAQGDYAGALEDINLAISKKSNSVQYLLNQGKVLTLLKRPQDAIDSYDRVLSLDGNSVMAYQGRSVANGQIKQYSKAISDANTAILLNPNSAQAYGLRCLWKNAARIEPESALSDCNRAVAAQPNNLELIGARSIANYLSGKYGEAIADATQVLKAHPRQPMALYVRGLARQKAGAFAEGAADIAAAKSFSPNVNF